MTYGVPATESRRNLFFFSWRYGPSEADADFYQPQEPTNHECTVSVHARCYRQHYHPALWAWILGREWQAEPGARPPADSDSD